MAKQTSEEERDNIIRLYSLGINKTKIAKIVERNEGTVSQIIKGAEDQDPILADPDWRFSSGLQTLLTTEDSLDNLQNSADASTYVIIPLINGALASITADELASQYNASINGYTRLLDDVIEEQCINFHNFINPRKKKQQGLVVDFLHSYGDAIVSFLHKYVIGERLPYSRKQVHEGARQAAIDAIVYDYKEKFDLNQSQQLIFQKGIEKLSEKQQRAISLRYGLQEGYIPKKVDECANEMGVTQQAVSGLLKAGLKALRNQGFANEFRQYQLARKYDN